MSAEALTLHTSTKTDTGYRCVYAHYQSKLGVVQYEVRTINEGKTVHLGRYKSKLQARTATWRPVCTLPPRARRHRAPLPPPTQLTPSQLAPHHLTSPVGAH